MMPTTAYTAETGQLFEQSASIADIDGPESNAAAGTSARFRKEQSESVAAILLPFVRQRFKRMDDRQAATAIDGMLAAIAKAGFRLFPNWPTCHECHDLPAERMEAYVDRLPEMRERTARMMAAARDNDIYRAVHRSKNTEE